MKRPLDALLFLLLLLPGSFIAAIGDEVPGVATTQVSTALAPQAGETVSLRVAVAANFRGAAEMLANEFQAETGIRILISSASTGILAAQLRRGSPHDLLLAADRHRPELLLGEGLVTSARCYARGSLVLLGASSVDALQDPTLSVAIANPDTAPYGAAAIQVLERYADSTPESRRVVRGSNVLQAYQFYSAGATDLALVARSLSPRNGIPVPAAWHDEIEQFAVVSAASRQADAAKAFLDYLSAPASKELLATRGYTPCS